MKKEDENKKSLDEYFSLAKEEKVKYSKDDTKKLLVKYGTAAGILSFLSNSWLKSIFNLKFISMSLVSVGSGLGVYYTVYKGTNEADIEKHNNSKIKNNEAVINNKVEEMNSGDKNIKLNYEQAEKVLTKFGSKAASSIQNKVNANASNIKKTSSLNMAADKPRTNNTLDAQDAEVYNDSNNENQSVYIDNKDLPRNLEVSSNAESNQQSNMHSYIAINQSKFESSQANSSIVSLLPKRDSEKDYIPAQEDHSERLHTLVYDFANENSISVSAMVRNTEMLGKSSSITGGKVLWTMDDRISAGLYGFGLSNQYKESFTTNDGALVSGNMQIGYGGGIFEYNFAPKEFFNYSAALGLGFGAASMSLDDINDNTTPTLWTTFYVIEPGVSAELSFFNFIKVGADVSYRYSNIFQKEYLYKNDPKVDNIQLSGLSAGLSIKVIVFQK